MRLLCLAVVLALVAGCGEQPEQGTRKPTPSPPPTATAAPPVVTPEAPERDYLRVAYVSMLSPIRVDIENPVAGETFAERLDMLVEQLKAVDADVVALGEVTWTKEHGGVTERLAKELRMEFQYARANPWFPGQSKEQSDTITRQIGFEEGEVILSRYPILRAGRYPLNPRTSETEGRALLHAVIQGPAGFGEVDIYVTRLTGGTDALKESQLASAVSTVARTRGTGYQVFLGDLALLPAAPGLSVFSAVDLVDLLAGATAFTCCRASVAGEQPALVQRTDYILARGLVLTGLEVFGGEPHIEEGREPLYASDHNGLVVSLRRNPE